jgi:hypothetical protein
MDGVDSKYGLISMRRRFFNLVTVLSAILCVATLLVWARSRSHPAILYFSHNHEPCRAWIRGGRVGIDNDPHVAIVLAKRDRDLSVMASIQGLESPDLMAPPPSNVPARWSRSSALLLPLLVITLSGFTVAPIIASWGIRRLRSATRLCIACGYNLTANTSGVCPECGTNIGRLSVE